MKTDWNYTELAQAYLKRSDYADAAVDRLVTLAGAVPGTRVCDVGAGVAHLTLKLAARGLAIDAVEPNDAMRALGIERTAPFSSVRWSEGTGEDTGRVAGAYGLVTFGSSFNVTDRPRALVETARILAPGGWFACLWNHRDVEDPLQKEIETAIRSIVRDYAYGTRREDQVPVIAASGLFGEVTRIEEPVAHEQSAEDCLEAWRSHATLERQAGARFGEVLSAIEKILLKRGGRVRVPYVTRAWMAPVKKGAR